MVEKLKGQAYIKHWEDRIARGPHEAGTEENADFTWSFIQGHLADCDPGSVLEYGCAYGRMLRRIRARWPKARLFGVDLSQVALDGLKATWPDKPIPVLFNRNTPPPNVRVDMIFTCTVIQHITDPDILRKVFAGFRRILNPGGKLVMYENVTWGKGQGGAHMSELSAQEYMDLWPELDWRDCGTLTHGLERHELLIGRKR
jgi:SAM-dependent methyltransferase